jgi:hypothetical protein
MTMMASRPNTAAARLRAALEATANALARPHLAGLLSAESELTAALAELPGIRTLDDAARQNAREELIAAKAALLSCRRLGSALSGFVRVSLEARGLGFGYESESAAAAELNGRGFQTRA